LDISVSHFTIKRLKKDYQAIAEKIIELKNTDLALRDKLIQSRQLSNGYNDEVKALHQKNAQILNDIINKIGYPTQDKVGKEASDATWLIIQHSIGQPKFMKKCAALLEKAVSENHANPINLAYLNDRIAVFEPALCIRFRYERSKHKRIKHLANEA
jgi:hypothetical protein